MRDSADRLERVSVAEMEWITDVRPPGGRVENYSTSTLEEALAAERRPYREG